MFYAKNNNNNNKKASFRTFERCSRSKRFKVLDFDKHGEHWSQFRLLSFDIVCFQFDVVYNKLWKQLCLEILWK